MKNYQSTYTFFSMILKADKDKYYITQRRKTKEGDYYWYRMEEGHI